MWPLSRFFDPRFGGLERIVEDKHADIGIRLDQVNRRLDVMVQEIANAVNDDLRAFRALLEASIDTTNESNVVVGRTLADMLAEVDVLREEVRSLAERVGADAAPEHRRETARDAHTADARG